MEAKYHTNDELVQITKERFLDSQGRTKAVVKALEESEDVLEVEVMYLSSRYEHEVLADEDDLKKIKSIAYEIQQGKHQPPLIVTGKYHVVDGNHHLLAAKMANVYSVPVIVVDLNE